LYISPHHTLLFKTMTRALSGTERLVVPPTGKMLCFLAQKLIECIVKSADCMAALQLNMPE
jgi:hypothetical protein